MKNDLTSTVSFLDRDIRLGDGGSFTLEISPAMRSSDLALIIDLYSLEENVHPHGHIGWWLYPVDTFGEQVEGRIADDGDGLRPHLTEGAVTDSWVNSHPPGRDAVGVAAVLRSVSTNAIVDMDRVPALADAAALEKWRSATRRKAPVGTFAEPQERPPNDATVRIVSLHVAARDAVGNLCMDLHRMFESTGIRSVLYSRNFDLAYNDCLRRLVLLPDDVVAGDILFYMHSTYDPGLSKLLELPFSRRIGYFHGVTDPKLCRVFDPELAAACGKAMSQMPLLQGFDRLVSNSRAMAGVLVDCFGPDSTWKAGDVVIAPPKIVPEMPLPRDNCEARPSGARLLCVGRVAPHKRLEQLLALFERYLELDPQAECWIVGGGGVKAYTDYLEWVEASELSLPPGRVKWFGSVDDSHLAELYTNADVLVSMSDHEGFCLPVIEAMALGIPVFAHGLDAVREVMGGAGRCFSEKDFSALAAEIHALLSDRDALSDMVARQRDRASAVVSEMDGSAYWPLLAP